MLQDGKIGTTITEFEKQEFWKGLGRLNDASVKLVAGTEEQRKTAGSHEHRLAERERRREKEGE